MKSQPLGAEPARGQLMDGWMDRNDEANSCFLWLCEHN